MFNKSIEYVLDNFQTSTDGLNDQEVKKRIEEDGLNKITLKKERHWIILFLKSFTDPLCMILMLSAIVALLTTLILESDNPDLVDPFFIFGTVILNAFISLFQELKTIKSVKALKKLSSPFCIVRREGKVKKIPADQLVCGDIVILEAGNIVPADLRIISANSLKVNESNLTGESLPVEKNQNKINNDKLMLGDQKNMLFSSTLIVAGKATAVVTRIGKQTEIGKIAVQIQNEKQLKTNLQRKINHFSKMLAYIAVILCIGVFILMEFTTSSELSETILISITLAISIMPESLPVMVSVALAISSNRMAKKNVIVKDLKVIESLGSVNIVCSDKTGTLTQNKMQVDKVIFNNKIIDRENFNYNSEKIDHFLNSKVLCNDAQIKLDKKIGDPTELGLIEFLQYKKFNELKLRDQYTRINEVPFDSERKLMTTVNLVDEHKFVYSKGAIDNLLNICKQIYVNGKVINLTKQMKDEILQLSDKLSEQALRVLGFAYKEYDGDDKNLENNLIFLGAIGMEDPIKESAKIAIQKMKAAGIKIVMITGDHKVTATAIAKKLEITQDDNKTLNGLEIDGLTNDELIEKLKAGVCIFSRVNPEHKVKIVKCLQQLNYTVAMNGDGINDAPSLKAADVGVAMGIQGTDVSKEAANVILVDDDFQTIISGIDEGRNVYYKIKKAIAFLLSSNLAQLISLLAIILIYGRSAESAANILWFNLIIESILTIPIAMSANNPHLMGNKPRDKNENIFQGIISSIIFLGVITGITAIGSYLIGNYCFEQNEQLASSFMFFTLIMAPIFTSLIFEPKVYNGQSFMKNKFLFLFPGVAFVLNIFIFFTPGVNGTIFGVTEVQSFLELFTLFSLSIIPFFALIIFQFFQKKISNFKKK
ncbi:cation-translocating P-type ATPase [Spiroplasma endosymbiont of Amphibalanus improvisus]|uniref:cation-translocating P-type ATPase n=1 Tax=Spiroplasma endosymbiont of Amphibalanus improvisus TaxID=3066327 RepID=UPI00313BF132